MKKINIKSRLLILSLFTLNILNVWSFDKSDSSILSLYQDAKIKQESGQIITSIALSEEGLSLAKSSNYLVGEFYHLLALNYSNNGQIDLAIDRVNLAITNFKETNQNNELLKCLEFLAKIYQNSGALDKEQEALYNALSIAEEIKEPAKIFDIRNAIGLNYYYKGDYEDANQYFINIAKDLESHKNLALQKLTNFRYMGIIHSAMENNNKAIAYYDKAIDVGLKNNLKSKIPTAYFNIGLIHITEKRFDKAEFSLDKGLKLAVELDDQEEIAYFKLAIADLYAETERLQRAKSYAKSALLYFSENKYLIDQGQTCGLLGNIYLKSNEKELAFDYLKKAEAIFIEADNKALRLQIFRQLSAAYTVVGDWKSAYEYQEKQIELEKVLSSNEKDKAVIELQSKFETEFKSKEQDLMIETLQKEKQYQNQQFYLSCILGCLLFLLCAALWSSSQFKNKKNAELTRAKIAAEKAAQAKSDFLAIMSHEIRTPLNGVVGMVNVLHTENLKPEVKESLEVLKFSADGLLNLINDILDFAKFESGNIELEQIPFDLDAFCKKSFSAYKNGAKASKVKIVKEINLGGLRNKVIGDKYRFSQVISNLANNALKFTEKGSVNLKIDILDLKDSEVKVRFAVTDTGIGISKEQQKTIFDKYTQASSNTTRLYGGTGLGLNISKEIVELYGSELKLKSELGKGSKFYFDIVFPLGEEVLTSASHETQKESDVEDKNLNGMRILLAEDNVVNQIVAKQILKKWNVDLTVANDGAIALDLFKNNEFDLVLLDIQMPNMDGLECAKNIRLLPNGTLPIYSMTASTLSVELKKEYAKLMNGHVGKPFNPEDLYNLLHKHVSSDRRRQAT